MFIVVKDAADPNRRIMAPLKNNIARDTDGFAFSVESATADGIETSRVVFEATVHKATAGEVLIERSEGGEALNEAKEFLEAMLTEGPMEAIKLQAGAKEVGINETTLRRAKKSLGIKSYKERDRWYQSLPGTTPTKPAPDEEEGIIESLEPWSA